MGASFVRLLCFFRADTATFCAFGTLFRADTPAKQKRRGDLPLA